MASKYLQKYPVPEGFQEILHDFTREVLRDQPEDIVKYAAHYFECLNTGRPFEYQSKYNIPKGAGPSKQHHQHKVADLSQQAKFVVEKSNGNPNAHVHVPTDRSRPTSNTKLNISHTSSGKESLADEKYVTKQFMNELLPKAVQEAVEGDQDMDQEGDYEQDEGKQKDDLLNAADFDHEQMDKVIKIQSHIRGAKVRQDFKAKKKNTQSGDL